LLNYKRGEDLKKLCCTVLYCTVLYSARVLTVLYGVNRIKDKAALCCQSIRNLIWLELCGCGELYGNKENESKASSAIVATREGISFGRGLFSSDRSHVGRSESIMAFYISFGYPMFIKPVSSRSLTYRYDDSFLVRRSNFPQSWKSKEGTRNFNPQPTSTPLFHTKRVDDGLFPDFA
jgi:hypothetical protein